MTTTVIFVLLIIALFALFRINPMRLLSEVTTKQEKYVPVTDALVDAKRKRLNGRKNFIERTRDNLHFTLSASGTGLRPAAFFIITAVCMLIGAGVGVAMKNTMLSIVVAAFLGCLPYQYLKIRSAEYKRLLHTQLESALSTITNAYMQSDDLLSSVEQCLPQIDQPLNGILRDELIWKCSLGANLEKSIRETDRKVNNRYFHEWSECMIRCQHNRNQKIGLMPIVQRLTDLKRMQAKVDTAAMSIWKDHIIISVMAVGALPVIKLLNADWYSFLRNTTIGKIIVCMTFAAVGLGTLYVFKINKPVAPED